jgi:hypothetical protein
MSEFMKSNAALDKDLNRAGTPDEIKELLYRAVERSQIGITRNLQTGQFESVSRENSVPAASAAEESVSKEVMIGGKWFTFSGQSEDVDHQIQNARAVVQELENSAANTQVEEHEPTDAERQQQLWERTQLEIAFKNGSLTTAEFLQKSHAIEDYLNSQGVDLNTLRETTQQHEAQSFEQSWEVAVQEFLKDSDWPGGSRNMHLCQTQLVAMGLENAEDKVAALQAAYQAMKQSGTIFETEGTQADVLKATEKMSPQELIEMYKQGFNLSTGDASQVNQDFIEKFRRKG